MAQPKINFNYRIIKSRSNNTTVFSLHEVYYDEAGSVKGWTEDPVNEFHNSVAELIEDLETILSDAKASKDNVFDCEDGQPASL